MKVKVITWDEKPNNRLLNGSFESITGSVVQNLPYPEKKPQKSSYNVLNHSVSSVHIYGVSTIRFDVLIAKAELTLLPVLF